MATTSLKFLVVCPGPAGQRGIDEASDQRLAELRRRYGKLAVDPKSDIRLVWYCRELLQEISREQRRRKQRSTFENARQLPQAVAA